MRQEVPTWLAVVIILVVLIVVGVAYVYFTKPKPMGEGTMPQHLPSGHHGAPIQKQPSLPPVQPESQ